MINHDKSRGQKVSQKLRVFFGARGVTGLVSKFEKNIFETLLFQTKL